MYLYRAMGINEFKKFMNGKTIQGMGTSEHKWVCFMPAEVSSIPTQYVRKVLLPEENPIDYINQNEVQFRTKKIDGENTFSSLTGIINSQLYIKFYIDDDKLNEIIKSGKGRFQYAQYIDDGISGEYTPENKVLLKELQLSDYSSSDMKIEQISLFDKYDSKALLDGLSTEEIYKICEAQTSAPILYYDKDAQFLFCVNDLDTKNKPILNEYPDVIVSYKHAGLFVTGTKVFFDRTQTVEDEYAMDFRKMAFQKFDRFLTSERGFIDSIPRDKDENEFIYETIQKMYEYKGIPVPEELRKFYQETVPKAKDSLRSEYLSSLTALELGDNIYIPVDYPSCNLFKDANSNKIISGEELLEIISSYPETIAKAIESDKVVISSSKELLDRADIKIHDEEFEFPGASKGKDLEVE